MTAAQDDLFAHARGYYVTKALLALFRLLTALCSWLFAWFGLRKS